MTLLAFNFLLALFVAAGSANDSPQTHVGSPSLLHLATRTSASAPHFETYSFRGDPIELMPPAGALSAGRVVVEVGVNGLENVADHFKRLEDDESLVLIGIEPNPAAGIWHPKHPRFVLLPVAIADVAYEPGAAPVHLKFHVTPETLCSSLLQPRPLRAHPLWMKNCTSNFVDIEVPVLPLAPVLARAATYGAVKLLDVDAQGAELRIVASAGATLGQIVERVQLEVTETEELDVYHGTPQKEDLVSTMTALGYVVERCYVKTWTICVFASPNIQLHVESNCFSPKLVDRFDWVSEKLFRRAMPPEVHFTNLSSHTVERTLCGKLGDWFLQEFTFLKREFSRQRCCLYEYLMAAGLEWR